MKRKKGFSPANLRDARLRTGKTQEEMAAELGVAQTQYSRYENGMAEPSGALIKHMALKMRVTTDYLFGLVSEPRSSLTFGDLSADEQRVGADRPGAVLVATGGGYSPAATRADGRGESGSAGRGDCGTATKSLTLRCNGA